MVPSLPSSLDSATLARRLAQLAGEERAVQVEFLLHLDEFDRRRAYLDAGYGSLWEYCLRALHLREGAAGRRIGAMRVLRRFPALAPALRDARLCLSTASLLAQVLTDDNLVDLVGRAAYRTKAEVEQLVVTIKPRPTPVEGVRRLSAPPAAPVAVTLPVQAAAASGGTCGPALALTPTAPPSTSEPAPPPSAGVSPPPLSRASPCEVRPVAEDRWSVRITLDAAAKADLDALRALLSHKIPDGDVGAVVREAIRCALDKHGKRRGASGGGASGRRTDSESPIAPAPSPHAVSGASPSASDHDSAKTDQAPAAHRTGTRDHIPAAVRREVWRRDGGRCTFIGPDGHRCESRWQLELDHVDPWALGGASTADKLRLRCRPHNLLDAERVFGRDHMDQFRRGGSGSPPDPGSTAREPEAWYGPHGDRRQPGATSRTGPIHELSLAIVGVA